MTDVELAAALAAECEACAKIVELDAGHGRMFESQVDKETHIRALAQIAQAIRDRGKSAR